MKTELKDMTEVDKLIRLHKEGTPDARQLLIEYISGLHERIRQLDMVNDLIVSHIQRYYK